MTVLNLLLELLHFNIFERKYLWVWQLDVDVATHVHVEADGPKRRYIACQVVCYL
jgi:hypothetical protein